MPTGTVKKWMGDRGCGFITPDDGSADVFVHMSALQDGNDYLTEGGAVEVEMGFDEKKGKETVVACSGGYNGGEWSRHLPRAKARRGLARANSTRDSAIRPTVAASAARASSNSECKF